MSVAHCHDRTILSLEATMQTQPNDPAPETPKGRRGGRAARSSARQDRDTSADEVQGRSTDPEPEPSTQVEPGAALADGPDAASAASPSDPTHEEIAAEAYARYAARNYEDGGDMDDWLAAELRLREAAREFGS
jgi:hypothetical protein